MENNGALEQLLDKMPYVAAVFLGITCIATLIYGIYSYAKKKNKQNLFVSVVYFTNIIFVVFLMFAITEIIRMDAGEKLSNEQAINLLLACIGIVMFNVIAYTKLGKKKRIMTDKEIEIVKEAMLNPGKRFEVKKEDEKIIITDNRKTK